MLNEIAEETALLRAVSSYRPIGNHRHFNMISIVQALHRAPANDESPFQLTSTSEIWLKLADFYDLNELNNLNDESDDEEAPLWLQSLEERGEFIEHNEGGRTRWLENEDQEEFRLLPASSYEPLIAPRRYENQEDDQAESSASSSEGASELDSDGTSNQESQPVRTRGRIDLRRKAGKRWYNEEAAESTSSSEQNSRLGKRRKAQDSEETTPAETPTRPITRRQRQLEDETIEDINPDTQENSAQIPASGRVSRRSASSVNATPEPARVAQTRSASSKSSASPIKSSSASNARNRTRRDTGK